MPEALYMKARFYDVAYTEFCAAPRFCLNSKNLKKEPHNHYFYARFDCLI